MTPAPHYLLFVEAWLNSESTEPSAGTWRFVLESLDGDDVLEARDEEAEPSSERLELLGLVRGLEALGQPSRVTLISASQHLNRGLRNGLPAWRDTHWQWERFGVMAPVKDHDLWQRVDNALRYHTLQSRMLRFDAAHGSLASDSSETPSARPSGAAKLLRGPKRRRGRTHVRGAEGWLSRIAEVCTSARGDEEFDAQAAG